MNNIKIYAFADEASPDIDEQITALKRNGLDGLEIRNVDGVNVSDITAEKAKEVKRKLQENGLVIWSVGSPIGKIDIEKDGIQPFMRICFCQKAEKKMKKIVYKAFTP